MDEKNQYVVELESKNRPCGVGKGGYIYNLKDFVPDDERIITIDNLSDFKIINDEKNRK